MESRLIAVAAATLDHVFDPDLTGADYHLRWPRTAFVAEARALLARAHAAEEFPERAGLLARHAFVGDAPARDLAAGETPLWWRARDMVRVVQHVTATWTTNTSGSPTGATSRVYLEFLVDVADRLFERPPRLYWHTRWIDHVRLQHDWTGLVDELRRDGFLDRAAPPSCALELDPIESVSWRQDYELGRQIGQRLGPAPLEDGREPWWPLHPGSWTQDELYALIEVVHDLVARPRVHAWHRADDYPHGYTGPDCPGHHHDFSVQAGRAVYCWRVDRLLEQHHAPVRFAHTGEDAGRLVRTLGEREDLVQAVLDAVPAGVDAQSAAAVRHAVALFRARDADREQKRSAVVALAGILETRRALLKRELLSKDEGALFDLANNYDLRHRRADQRGDYDEAFLDWVFWWYLSTIELTDRLLARDASDPDAS